MVRFRCGECGEQRDESERTTLTKATGAPVCGRCEVDVLLARLDASADLEVTHQFLSRESAERALEHAPFGAGCVGTLKDDGLTVAFTR